jgi:hypothetical protein
VKALARRAPLRWPPSPPPLTPPRADDSTTEPSDPRAIANYSELFAAEVGNVEWLRFCLNRDRRGITTDGKVRPWSVEVGRWSTTLPAKSSSHSVHLEKI